MTMLKTKETLLSWERPAVTLLEEPVITETYGDSRAGPKAPHEQGQLVVSWVTSTDHKVIAYLYFITAFVFFLIGGLMALTMRAELTEPDLQFVSLEQYNQLFTMHGTIMLLLFATPLFAGFANAIMPLQIGSPDVAFPRLNMLAYWFFLLADSSPSLVFSPREAQHPLVGPRTRRSPTLCARPVPAQTCGFSVWL